MYIVAVAWLYVAFMMAVAEVSVTAAVMTFLLYGVFPLSIILYLMGTPARRRRRKAAEAQEAQRDGAGPVAPRSDSPSDPP